MPKIKVHKASRLVIAVCDSELQGRVLEKDGQFLDLSTTFFDGEEITRSELVEELQEYRKEDASFNIVGEESCEMAIKAGIVKRESIGNVCGAPFILILL